MKPSYREHYFNLAAEHNRTKNLVSEQVFTKAVDNNPAAAKLSGEPAEESIDIGSEDCSVNVFEDGTILKDGLGDAAGQSSSYAATPSFPLDGEAMIVEEEKKEDGEEVEEMEHAEEGGKEDDDEEESIDETELLEEEEEEEKGNEDDLVGRTILAKEENIKEEEEDLGRQDTDPLDMEVRDETGEVFAGEAKLAQEQIMKSLSSNLPETLVEREDLGETLVDRCETAEEASAREVDEATMSIVDPDRGEREAILVLGEDSVES